MLDLSPRMLECTRLEKWVGFLGVLSGDEASVESSAKAEGGALGDMGMGGSSHLLAAFTQSSLASLHSCLVDDSIVFLNIVFLLQQHKLQSLSVNKSIVVANDGPSYAGSMLRKSRQ